MRKIVFFLLAAAFILFPAPLLRADELEDVTKQLTESQKKLEDIKKAQENLSKQLSNLSYKISLTSKELNNVESDIAVIAKNLEEVEKSLGNKRGELKTVGEWRDKMLKDMYKQSKTSALDIFLASPDFTAAAKNAEYFSSGIAELKNNIVLISQEITSFEKTREEIAGIKVQLESQRAQLNNLIVQLSYKKSAAEKEKSALQSQIGALTSQISNLTEKQKKLIEEKFAATARKTSIGDVEEKITMLPNPPFSPAFAVFSRGYPHRVGMSQYGAYGRSKAGQNYKQILTAYYNVSAYDIKVYQPYTTIRVLGCSVGPSSRSEKDCKNRGYRWYDEVVDFETYIKSLGEMPSYWGSTENGGMEALKAQAVAARSYALTYGGTICPSTYCQYYLGYNKGSYWEQAVDATVGEAIVPNNEPIKAWYASTAGGYTRLPTDFDVKWGWTPPYVKRVKDADGAGKFYEGPGYANSPWFYKAWYDPQVDVHPWLTQEEMQDLLDAAQLPFSYNPNLSNPSNGGWDHSRVKQELAKLGKTPIGAVSKIGISDSSEGFTSSVWVISSNYPGGAQIDGTRFREIFVIRSRGHLALWSSLYDIVYDIVSK